MSKIRNGGWDQYGTEPFEWQQFGTSGVEWVNRVYIVRQKSSPSVFAVAVKMYSVLIIFSVQVPE